MTTFAVVLVHDTGWDDARGIREQDGWDEHAAFMDALVEEGFVLHGGPVGDGTRTLHLVVEDDEDDVRARLATDPWARDRHLAVGSVERWQLWLGPVSGG